MKKAINFTIDEGLLERLDSCTEVRVRGRSAVVREALTHYLDRKMSEEEAEAIQRAYERAYGPGTPPNELEDWAAEAVWLE